MLDCAHRVDSEPGSLKGVQVNVDDADAHAFLRDRGVEVTEIQAFPWGRFGVSLNLMVIPGRSTNLRRGPEVARRGEALRPTLTAPAGAARPIAQRERRHARRSVSKGGRQHRRGGDATIE
jgi:hypothetical protein